jgi:hypothetical protein
MNSDSTAATNNFTIPSIADDRYTIRHRRPTLLGIEFSVGTTPELLPNGRPKYPMWISIADAPGGGVEVHNAAEEEYVRAHGVAGMPRNRLPPTPPPSYAEAAESGVAQAKADLRARDEAAELQRVRWMTSGVPLG